MRQIVTLAAFATVAAAGLYLALLPSLSTGGARSPNGAHEAAQVSSGNLAAGPGDASRQASVARSDGAAGATAPAPVGPLPQPAVDSGAYSATERSLLSQGMITEASIAVLRSSQFERIVARFEDEQLGLTADLTAAYRAELQRLLDPIAEPTRIDRLVCGTELCLGSIRSPSQGWYPAWSESIQGLSALPIKTLTGNSVDLGASGVEHRLLFSISGGVKGFSGTAPP